MYLKIDHDAYMHQKVCKYLADFPNADSWDDCDCKKHGVIKAGTKICLLRTEKGIAFITTEDGQIGCVRASWWTILVWRFNTVVIRNVKDWNGEDLLVAGLLFAFFFGIGFGVFSLIKTSSASGEVDYCTVKIAEKSAYEPPYYYVEGHRSWRNDVNLFYTKSREEADAKMLEICPKR